MNCPLCESPSIPFYKNKFRDYLRCTHCLSIFMEKSFLPTKEEENKRYLEHNNDIYDIKYQNFLKPIVDKVLQFQKPDEDGLDFGAGPHSAIEYLLKQNGYSIRIYDPFFHPYDKNLLETYDYITLTEVVEHFHSPKLEFQKLKGLLKQNGSLYILTHPYDDSINFEKWYYKNDQTHTFFYTTTAFDWILNHYGFKTLEIQNRIIILKK
ncbi:class I SAM-dependent methyltransferase [Leptospira kanakyensis]|uniref:Class I SAM-dependent methyltransferase n=1 Tax=Leptospira kanakyensis TaxID=2484968 RepID=A0A6N4QLA0_9LEPT|nr:class I SAM-dependent methyltransferase [Leptospira kanakyensis]MCW7468356.1 class I SAM-dependent methyltransferase [Leptospira kanakyensis]TGK55434.1 class I SAM-dependent methyltransferase [Leptospira kanakyensis]TGK60968.1 class I SAM-dependent methyltransferase [Leptospira kanakyensis]TGK76558.1 class I SAM-dependent methyltransferase [Leptospira kanakyensis]